MLEWTSWSQTREIITVYLCEVLIHSEVYVALNNHQNLIQELEDINLCWNKFHYKLMLNDFLTSKNANTSQGLKAIRVLE